MFKAVVDRPRRRIWTPRTVALSAGAHLLVLTAFAAAASARPGKPREEYVVLPMLPPRAHVEPQAPQQPRTQPPATFGHTRELQTPATVPNVITPPNPATQPTDPSAYNGEGPIGDSIGTPTPDPGPPAAQPGDSALRNWGDGDVIDADRADVQPELTNRAEAQRMLERVYPPLLRDAGVSGRTTVTLIIGRDGKVEPGSVSVQESTHDAFREAAIRAAERFRFRPARYRGQPVAVVIALPIDWQIRQ